MKKSVSGRRFLWCLWDDMLDPYRKPFEIKVLFWQEKQYADKVTSEPGLHIFRGFRSFSRTELRIQDSG